MILFLIKRFGVMALTALVLTFVVFFLTNLYPNLEKLAKFQGNQRMTDAEVASYLENNGYLEPIVLRYGQWLGVVPGWRRQARGRNHTRPMRRVRHGARGHPQLLRPASGQSRTFHGLQGGGERDHLEAAGNERSAHVLGHGGHGPDGTCRRGFGRDARGIQNRPEPFDLCDHHDSNPGIHFRCRSCGGVRFPPPWG